MFLIGILGCGFVDGAGPNRVWSFWQFQMVMVVLVVVSDVRSGGVVLAVRF